ncbi:MAG: type II toxin-antitoxin system VapC family toxin [Rickettsia sp.]|uniref:type II toxin-antitoxin system VapC family toxin n=1 Tax=Rickettsia sp. TaxID=789 RepID=UPI00397DDAE9
MKQKMNNVIFDASTLLALIKNESVNIELKKLLGNVSMSSVNVSEVAGILLESGMSYQECKNYIEPFVNSIVPFDEEQSFLAATIKKQTRHLGLSLGDRACITLWLITGYPIYTADKAWANVQLNCKIILIR